MLIRKPALSMFFALLSNVVLAGTMGSTCNGNDGSLTCMDGGWELGLQALLIKPSYSSAMNWVGVNTNFGATFLSTTRIENTPDWTWGFKLEGLYHLSNGNNLNLNWYHLTDKTTRGTSLETDLSRNAQGENLTQIIPNWDAINVELVQGLEIGEIKNVRLHTGIQIADIKSKTGVNGPLMQERTLFRYNYVATSKYWGVGPRLGTDISHNLFGGIGWYGTGAVSILAGKSKLTQNYTDTTLTENYRLRTTSATAIVPELEAKLGLNYIYSLNKGTIIFDAGYMWVNYFNVLFSTKYNRSVENDFSVNGPYLGLKWLGTSV
ncbi:MAG: Lpg1974 family pore-forming outer membrane protein [bacterium]|nr:Lpg1974 family pore-forming outer membrane protein [bacterium]